MATPMKTMVAAVVAVACVLAGCSSDHPAKLQHGVLSPGTAQLTIDGNDAGKIGSVQCAAVATRTTIRTGDDNAGVTVQLSNATKLTVELVRIRNMDGFSGDYNLGLGGDDAAAALTESTYHITGTAFGYRSEAIAPTKQQFAMQVAC
jgi:ipoprotein LpqH